MIELTLTDVGFKRSILWIEGISSKAEKNELFFVNSKTDQRIELYIESWEAGRFTASVSMFGCNNGNPIETGHWYIGVEDTDDSVVRAAVSDDLYDLSLIHI